MEQQNESGSFCFKKIVKFSSMKMIKDCNTEREGELTIVLRLTDDMNPIEQEVTVCSMTVPAPPPPPPHYLCKNVLVSDEIYESLCFYPPSSDFTPTNEPQTPILSQISDLNFMVLQMLAEKGGF